MWVHPHTQHVQRQQEWVLPQCKYLDSVCQGKLEKKLKQIPYQNRFVPRSCIRSGLATQNLFTLDIHRMIFRRVKFKMVDYLTEIT